MSISIINNNSKVNLLQNNSNQRKQKMQPQQTFKGFSQAKYDSYINAANKIGEDIIGKDLESDARLKLRGTFACLGEATVNPGDIAKQLHKNHLLYNSMFKKIRKMRDLVDQQISSLENPSPERRLEIVWSTAQSKGLANCGEVVAGIMLKLYKHHPEIKKARLIYMDIKTSNKNSRFDLINDHLFVVIGMKRNAKLDNTSTWGKHALIIDAWIYANQHKLLIGRPMDVLEIYKREFKVNPDINRVLLSSEKCYAFDKTRIFHKKLIET